MQVAEGVRGGSGGLRTRSHVHGEDILGQVSPAIAAFDARSMMRRQGELHPSGEDFPPELRVLQRAPDVASQRGARILHAGAAASRDV